MREGSVLGHCLVGTLPNCFRQSASVTRREGCRGNRLVAYDKRQNHLAAVKRYIHAALCNCFRHCLVRHCRVLAKNLLNPSQSPCPDQRRCIFTIVHCFIPLKSVGSPLLSASLSLSSRGLYVQLHRWHVLAASRNPPSLPTVSLLPHRGQRLLSNGRSLKQFPHFQLRGHLAT